MRKFKVKNDSLWQGLIFIVLWAGSYGVSWWIVNNIPLSDIFYDDLTYEQRMVVSQIIFTLVSALLQLLLIEKILKRSSRGWLLYSILGALISCIGFVYTDFASSFFRLVRSFMAMTLPAALAQILWLRRHVKYAWLWPLITLIADFVCVVSFWTSRDAARPWLMLIFGVIQGIGLYTLYSSLRKEKTKYKAKVAGEETTLNQAQARLQETAETALPWIYEDDQQAKSIPH